MALDLSSLKKAINSLGRSIRVAASHIRGSADSDKKQVIRAGVIQNFEFTYELCWKFMRRWLGINANSSDVDAATRKELFRMAAESRLITDVEKWFEYTKSRNETAHTYNEETAEEVYLAAIRFVKDAKALLKVLESKND